MMPTSTLSSTPRAQRINQQQPHHHQQDLGGMGSRSLTSPPCGASVYASSSLSPSHVSIAMPSLAEPSGDAPASLLPQARGSTLHCSPRSVASSLSNRSSRLATAQQRPHRVVYGTASLAITDLESTTVNMMPSATNAPSASPPNAVANDSFALGATVGSLMLSPPTLMSPDHGPSQVSNGSLALPPSRPLPISASAAAASQSAETPSDDSVRRSMIRRDARGNIVEVNGVTFEEATLRGGSTVSFFEMVALGCGLLSCSLVLIVLAMWYLARSRASSSQQQHQGSESQGTNNSASCETLCPDTLRDVAIALSVLFGCSLIAFTFLCRRRVSQGRRRAQVLSERGMAVSTPSGGKGSVDKEMSPRQSFANLSADSTPNSSSTLSRQALMAHDLATVPNHNTSVSDFGAGTRPLCRTTSVGGASGAGLAARRPGTSHSIASGTRARATSLVQSQAHNLSPAAATTASPAAASFNTSSEPQRKDL